MSEIPQPQADSIAHAIMDGLKVRDSRVEMHLDSVDAKKEEAVIILTIPGHDYVWRIDVTIADMDACGRLFHSK